MTDFEGDFMSKVLRSITAAGLATGLALTASGCGSGGSNNAGGERTLVAETTFSVRTLDPAYQFEFTGATVNAETYQTLLEFEDGDLTKPGSGLCDYEMSDDNKEMTLTCEDTGAKFSNGDPVTVDDMVFSLQRTQGAGGEPSFYLDGVTVEKVDDETIKLTSEEPNAALPYILPNPNLGVVNSKVVKENGGTTDENDDAEKFINENSQGSGPYYVEKYDDSEIILQANEHYNGPAPEYSRVVFKNVNSSTQVNDIQAGQAQVAYELNSDQVKTLDDSRVNVETIPSSYSLFIFHNEDESIGGIAANKDFQQAVRYAVDYDKVVGLGGEGAKRLAGILPEIYLGAVPESEGPKRDVAKAKDLLKKSGYNGEAVPFHFSSDQTVSGVSLSQLAETLQASLSEVGIKLELKPAPSSTQLDGFRSGKQPMGIGTWGADFPDPSNYHVFMPENTLGARVNWKWDNVDGDLKSKLDTASKAVGDDEREKAYKDLYSELSETGPWVPLVNPITTVVISKDVKEYVSNADRSFDFRKAK